MGNRLTQTVNGSTTNYIYNNLDQLLAAGTAQYQYDGRGNLARVTNSGQTASYSYNAADRLTRATMPDGTVITNAYDVDGHRVKQSVGSQVTNYLWDEASPFGDMVMETNGSGSIQASYVLGGTGLISQTGNGTTNYFLEDGQGSVRNLTDATGNVIDSYAYTAFGETFSHSGTAVNPYQYTGRQYDASMELYSLRARYYDPTGSRFLSRDTFGYNLDNPLDLNRYAYTANNPINAIDPSGHQVFAEYAVNVLN